MAKNVVKNIITLLRYLLFLPISILGAVLVSFVVHFVIKVFCLFPAYWAMDACNSQRPFFVEFVLLFIFVQLSVLIIPRFKKIIALLELIPIGLFYTIVPFLSFIVNKPFDEGFDMFVLGLLSLLASVLIIKKSDDLKIIIFNQDTHFIKYRQNDKTERE